ncbi:hypothetical protein [Rhodopseudomonas palustris]|uniref:hypothetical protein n=1 Tax=Rhodopseudomonas palustris TaxID=1076 RepID=UPI000310B7C7
MRVFERLRQRYGAEARQRAAELDDQQARLLAEIKSSDEADQAGQCCGCSIGHEASAQPAAARR